MRAHVIDGRACADTLRASLTAEVAQLEKSGPGVSLATVMIGGNYSAAVYESRLHRLSDKIGVSYTHRRLPENAGQESALAVIDELNASPGVSGILILRPLPGHIDEAELFCRIDPLKDIEAVHPENAGLLALGIPRFVPSTAASAFHLLDTWLDTAGENRADFYHRSLIVVVGRSNNVGKPAVSLGYERQATVESLDEWADRTAGIGHYTRWADVLIVAAGKPALIKAEHVSEGAIVIDIGINPRSGPDGRIRMTGDVDYDSVASRARAVTPVPGGVGPVTDVWLLKNTVAAARLTAAPALP